MGELVVLSLVSPIAPEVDVYLFRVVQLLKGCAGVSHLKFYLTSQKRLCDTECTYQYSINDFLKIKNLHLLSLSNLINV